jgi:hypothetical protein
VLDGSWLQVGHDRGAPQRLPRRHHRAPAAGQARRDPARGRGDARRTVRRPLLERLLGRVAAPLRQRQRLPRAARPRLSPFRRHGRIRRADRALLEAGAALRLDPGSLTAGRDGVRRPRPADRFSPTTSSPPPSASSGSRATRPSWRRPFAAGSRSRRDRRGRSRSARTRSTPATSSAG